ncbi:MAG: RNA polymerase sigma factor [Saprospiraceae bacterium]
MTQELFISTVLPLRDKCYRFAASILRNGPESEDVAQEVLLKMWDRRDQLDEINNLEAWAIRATRNLSLDRKRHSAWKTGDVDALYAHSSNSIASDTQVEQREAVDAVFDCMKQLPEMQRNVLHLREVEELSYDEIAQALDLSAPQVKVYLHRARKKVREQLDPSHAPNAQTRQSQTND